MMNDLILILIYNDNSNVTFLNFESNIASSNQLVA